MASRPSAARPSERLAAALTNVIALRRRLRADPRQVERWMALKQWQSERLRQTYPDLFGQARYQAAGDFFLTELYGARDFEQRDHEALRVVSKLARMLPERALETIALAVELDGLSEELDAAVAACIEMPIDEDRYAQAYQAVGTLASRQRQIEMVDQIGTSLERLARLPLLSTMIHMMRGPAEAMGFGHLHRFLQSGFDAFKTMGPAQDFLRTVRMRETALMHRLFDRVPAPFAGFVD